MMYVVTGPEKSGKSARAERLAMSLGERRIYLATMIPYGAKGEERVARHRALRSGKGFETVERPDGLDRLPLEGRPVVLLECVLNLAANVMFGRGEEGALTSGETAHRVCAQILALNRRCAHLVAVTGELCSQGLAGETLSYAAAVQEINRRLYSAAKQVFCPPASGLSCRRVAIVGTGREAVRAVRRLAAEGAALLVLGPKEICAGEPAASLELERLEQEGAIHWERRPLDSGDLRGTSLVIALSRDEQVNRMAEKLCETENIPVLRELQKFTDW